MSPVSRVCSDMILAGCTAQEGAGALVVLHARLTELTPLMAQALGKQKDVTVDSINRTVDDRIVAK